MIELQPINETFVAGIERLDVSHLCDASFDEVYAAWLQLGVLRWRKQPVEDDAFQAFSTRFGPCEFNRPAQHMIGIYQLVFRSPAIFVVSR